MLSYKVSMMLDIRVIYDELMRMVIDYDSSAVTASSASSDGSTSGNQPYSSKSTLSSPMALATTTTPSARSASAWFWAPPGWDLNERWYSVTHGVRI